MTKTPNDVMPTDIQLHQKSREIAFDDGARFRLP